MEEKFSILLFIISLIDFYYNYYCNDFPEFHKIRLYSDFLSLICIMVQMLLFLFVFICGCFLYFKYLNNSIVEKCTTIFSNIILLMVIVFAISSISMQVYSIYLYFKGNGSEKITKIIIKILMWLTLVNTTIKLFFTICDIISSYKKYKKENENNDESRQSIELEDQL